DAREIVPRHARAPGPPSSGPQRRGRSAPGVQIRLRGLQPLARLAGLLVLQQLLRLLRVRLALAVRRAERGNRAGAAGGLSGVADAAAVPDDVVGEVGPVALREQRADRRLDLVRVGLV